jgi:hypothetical protein
MQRRIPSLFESRLKVINIGLSLFAESLRQQQVVVAQVDWRPPAGGDMELLRLLDRLGQDQEQECTNER